MSLVRRIALALAVTGGLLLVSAVPVSAETVTGGVSFTVELTGQAEVTPPTSPTQWGDPDGSGTATVTVNPGLGLVCWTVAVTGVSEVLEAHIHKAPSTANGPIVVPFEPDYSGGCIEVSRELALDLVLNPSSYYVNVHTTEYPRPAGAVRGQLGR